MSTTDTVSKTNMANIISYTKYVFKKEQVKISIRKKKKERKMSKFQLQFHCSHCSPLRVKQFPNLWCTTHYWWTEPNAQAYEQPRDQVVSSW